MSQRAVAPRSGLNLFDRLQADVRGFKALSETLKTMAGISLPENSKNLSLMASRLHGIIADHGLESYDQLLGRILAGETEIRKQFLHALTTNTTQFYREARHFDLLREYLPGILAAKKVRRELRVWCAAASTGQEPYTIAISLLESIPDAASWDIRFLATDIDENVLAAAIRGVYAEKEMEGVPPLLRQKYFQPVDRPNGRFWRAKGLLRNMIRFARLNLVGEYPFQHKFDVIFCRNVLIYFDRETVAKVVASLSDALGNGGYFFVGHSETGAVRRNDLEPVSSAVYRKKAGDLPWR